MEGICGMQSETISNRSDQSQRPMSQAFDTDTPIDKPKEGMEFDTYDALVEYYARYARQEGFAVCRRTCKKGKDGKLRYALVECNRAGKPKENGANIFKPRPQTKLNCPARIRACLSANDKWMLTFVCLEHNHENSPSKVRHFKSYRKIDEETKRRLEYHDQAGIKLNKTFDLLQIEVGGPEHLPFSQKDCQNYISKVRRLRLAEGDAKAMNDYFIRMKKDNDEFFSALDLDEKGRLKNVFWADARSRAACIEFGDVVTFDTTYLVNKYDMPFSPFVSVNQHGHSVLLGCGLVSHEDTNSFIWLFETWLACMRGRVPEAIITDQCMAMKNAIEYVFPSSRHRWCIWHIMKKVPQKLSGYKEFERMSYCMRQAVYDSLTVKEFEASWCAFITKYDLHSNTWLNELYVERARWVPAFVKDLFWAGMSSTQRSENINAYFDGFVNARTTLKQFVEQYENALTKKVEIERKEDARSWKSFIPCINKDDTLEAQFQSVYTNEKVREFQKEIRRRYNCHILTSSRSEYEIMERIDVGEGEGKHKKCVSFHVLFNEETNEAHCNCRLFEFKGMVCAHQLLVWNFLGIEKVPDKYVFRRWCKNVKRVHSKVPICYDKSSKGIEARRRESMLSAFKNVIELVEESEDKYEKVMTICRDLKQEFEEALGVHGSNVVVDTARHDDSSTLGNDVLVPSKQRTTILDPEPVRRRGRTPFKRRVSIAEKIVIAKKRKLVACRKYKKRQSSNEENEVHHHIVMGTQHSLSTLNTSASLREPSSQNNMTSQLPGMSSQVSHVWNLSQPGFLEQLSQIQHWVGSRNDMVESPWKTTREDR